MKVKVTWKAFGDKPDIGRFVTSASFEILEIKGVFIPPTHDAVLNAVYRATNLQDELGSFGNQSPLSHLVWSEIKGILPENRTHTSISIGDEVDIDGQTYICADIGWLTPEEADIKYLSAEYGNGAIFSVSKKWVS